MRPHSARLGDKTMCDLVPVKCNNHHGLGLGPLGLGPPGLGLGLRVLVLCTTLTAIILNANFPSDANNQKHFSLSIQGLRSLTFAAPSNLCIANNWPM